MRIAIYEAHPRAKDRWGVASIEPDEIMCPVDNRPIVKGSMLTDEEVAALRYAGVIVGEPIR